MHTIHILDGMRLALYMTSCNEVHVIASNLHYKNKRVGLTQLELSQLHVHYPTMCIQALSWDKATVLFLQGYSCSVHVIY